MTTEIHDPTVVAEMNKNRKAYEAVRERMESEHWGRTILIHDGAVVAIYNDHGDAYAIGSEKFGKGKFSLHMVGQRPVDLGFQSIVLA